MGYRIELGEIEVSPATESHGIRAAACLYDERARTSILCVYAGELTDADVLATALRTRPAQVYAAEPL